jgi:alpha-N-arabinofuranosidase
MKAPCYFLKQAAVLFGLVINASSLPAAESAANNTSITLDLSQPGANVSPALYGLMTEEINHSYDGGLYAELIRNRIFKDDTNEPAHWSVVQSQSNSASILLDESQPINNALTTCLKLDVKNVSGDRVGIANDGFWGIPVKPNDTYRASFYARSAKHSGGPLTLSIQSNDGATVFATARVRKITDQWRRYTVTLTIPKNVQPSGDNRFVISPAKPGTYWFNLVSLFPPTWNNRPNGNRADMMQLLADMKPAFLRFPGGNYLEGRTLAERFAFKNTIHDISQRPGKMVSWGYRSTDGMGLLEFLEWCEDLKMRPVLAVFAGYTLNRKHIAAGADLQPYVQEALDEIEYVTGDNTTAWGSQRAADGHPAPFPLTYVEIGNEDEFDRGGNYEERFAQFYDAIKAKYPRLQLIATTKITNRQPDLIDEHFYRTEGQMQDMANHYDTNSRSGPKIFVGEWATREGGPTPNLKGALGDAAWMTGMERNSDLVVISSYAPLFVNVNRGAMQWRSDLIGYDALTSYGSPSYYAQKMFNTYLGDKVVAGEAENIPTQTWKPPTPRNRTAPPPKEIPTLFFVATRSTRTGTIYLKVVNTAATAQSVRINLKGVAAVSSDGLSVVLTSPNPLDTNSINDPTKIVPVTMKISGLGASFTRDFAPYSINILKIEAQ